MDDDKAVDAAARALRDAANTFRSPVYLYVEPEARLRAEKDGFDPYDEKFDAVDWELESWKILARAALTPAEPEKEKE